MSNEYIVYDTKNKIMFVKLKTIIESMEYFEKHVILLQETRNPMYYLNRTSSDFLKRFSTNIIDNIESFISALEIQKSPDKYAILFSIDSDKNKIQENIETLKTNSFSNDKTISLKNFLSNINKITNIFYGVLNRNQLGVKDNSYSKNDFPQLLADLENEVEDDNISMRDYIIKVLRTFYCHITYMIYQIDRYEKQQKIRQEQRDMQNAKSLQKQREQNRLFRSEKREITKTQADTLNPQKRIQAIEKIINDFSINLRQRNMDI